MCRCSRYSALIRGQLLKFNIKVRFCVARVLTTKGLIESALGIFLLTLYDPSLRPKFCRRVRDSFVSRPIPSIRVIFGVCLTSLETQGERA